MQVSTPVTVFLYIRHRTISEKAKETIAEYTRRLARALHVIGMINIQFIVLGDEVYVIEVNPRSSRTVPYISKVTGIPIVPLATKVILGYKLKEMGYDTRSAARGKTTLPSRCRYSPLKRSVVQISALDLR